MKSLLTYFSKSGPSQMGNVAAHPYLLPTLYVTDFKEYVNKFFEIFFSLVLDMYLIRLCF